MTRFPLQILAVLAVHVHAQNILLFDDLSGQQASRAALNQLSVPYVSGDLNTFNGLLSGQSWDLVVIEANDEIPVDIPGIPIYGSTEWDDLRDYVSAGGKAVFSFWDAEGDVYSAMTVVEDFGVNQAFSANIEDATGRTLTPWAASHPVFNGPGGTMSNPIPLTEAAGLDGSFLDPLPGFTALAGFQPTAQPFWGGILLGNGDRTIYNGITLDRLALSDAQALLANEIQFLLQVPEPSSLALVFLGLAGLIRWRRRVL